MDISWSRVRSIFGSPMPPENIWERQFDNFDGDLQRLARTHWEKIDFADLWLYHYDLAYVDLQPELFMYLFPVCLMDWHETLLRNTSCSHGASDFHHGIHQGRIFEKMVTAEQRVKIFEFFRDSFLFRIDRERGLIYQGSKTPAYGWMYRLNSLGIIMPRIDMLWNAWWSLDTPGRAVAAIEYCSGLIYYEGENPLFPAWTPESGGGGPYLWENDSQIYNAGWMEANRLFLQRTFDTAFVTSKVAAAIEVLKSEPEWEMVRQIQTDMENRIDLLTSRIRELPSLLADHRACGWSM